MSIHHTTRCPSCGHTWERRKARGRPRSVFLKAEGKVLHQEDWALELGVCLQTILRYRKTYPDWEIAVRLLRKPKEEEYAQDVKTPIITVGDRGWRAPLKSTSTQRRQAVSRVNYSVAAKKRRAKG